MAKAIPALLVLVVFVVASAAAQNLLTNGSFDHGLSGWTMQSGPVTDTWSSVVDLNGSPSSGSAEIEDTEPSSMPSTAYYAALFQCVPISGDTDYTLSGALAIPSGQVTTGRLAISVDYFSDTACNTASGSVTFSVDPSNDGSFNILTSKTHSPAGTVAAEISLNIQKDQAGGAFHGFFDELSFQPTSASSGSCIADATHLCLTGNRFRVSVEWYDYNNGNVAAAAQAVPFAGETGFFYFKNSANLELMVKVVDACSQPYYHYWFFAAATTDVGYTITVTDTKTGQTETYSNPPHNLSAAVTDQSSFDSCP